MAGVYKRIPKQYSDELESFIRLCLKVRPSDRSSAEQLLKCEYILKKTSKI